MAAESASSNPLPLGEVSDGKCDEVVLRAPGHSDNKRPSLDCLNAQTDAIPPAAVFCCSCHQQTNPCQMKRRTRYDTARTKRHPSAKPEGTNDDEENRAQALNTQFHGENKAGQQTGNRQQKTISTSPSVACPAPAPAASVLCGSVSVEPLPGAPPSLPPDGAAAAAAAAGPAAASLPPPASSFARVRTAA